MKIHSEVREKTEDYEVRVYGKAESRIAKIHLFHMMFAIQDVLRLEEILKEKND